MMPIRRDHEPKLSDRNRREDFPPRQHFEKPAVSPPDSEAVDRSPLVGWLAISGLTLALGVVGYFVLFGGSGPDSEFRAGGDTLELPQLGQPAAAPFSDRQDTSLRPKSISSGTGPVETLAETSTADQESAARAEIAVATPQQTVASPPEAIVSPPEILSPPEEEAPRLSANPVELAHLLGLADSAISRGDIAVARDFYETAYDSGSAEAATAMARTYDPLFLQELATLGVRPDPDVAVDWYRRGEEEGDPRARQHLDSLLLWLRERGQGAN